MYCQAATGTNRKMYVLKVTTFQLAILHQFNINDKLTTEQIKEQTALDEKGTLSYILLVLEGRVAAFLLGRYAALISIGRPRSGLLLGPLRGP